MRILFGIQGTGNGHLSRCHRIASALKRYVADVDYLVSGRTSLPLFDDDVFGNYRQCRGLTMVTEGGRVRPLKTIRQNNLAEFKREVNKVAIDDYDLVVSDFEPVTAWAAKLAGKRCIGIGRQYAFKDASLYRQLKPWQRVLIDHFAPADEWLGMHWQPLDNCLPPVVRTQIRAASTRQHVLVYLPFEELYRIVDALLPYDQFTFTLFHPDIRSTKYFASDHLIGLPPSRTTFAEQLSLAEGIIANAGFETTCEALNQGKHLAVKPVSGQFEQYWNAHLLTLGKRATVLSSIDEHTLGGWLNKLLFYPRPAAIQWANVADTVAEWLADGAAEDKNVLRSSLWNGSPGWIRTNDTWINSPPL